MFQHLLPRHRVPHEQVPDSAVPSEEDRRQALAAILASETLRRSDQLRAILQFLCDAAIEGRGSQVSESVIAIDVLNRNHSYNPTDDSSVRSRVYALRQKLTHYYEVENPSAPIRIEIPKGSYIPQFLSHPAPAQGKKTLRRDWRLWLVGSAVVVSLLAFLFIFNLSHSRIMNVWGPLIESGKPVLVSIGEERDLPPSLQKQGAIPGGEDGSDVDSREVNRVGTGAARALFRLGGLFGQFHIASQLRLSTVTSLEDLHRSPTVLLGAFNNQLTLDATRALRYRFVQHESGTEISDSKDPSIHWQRHQGQKGQSGDDYGIAVRLVGQESQEAMIIAAGLEQCGTAASMELLTDRLPELNQRMPAGWKRKNFEVLVATRVVDSGCGAPEIVRIEVW